MRLLQLELTSGCNLRCSHCYNSSSAQTYSLDVLRESDYARVLHEAVGHFSAISFLGGEPLTVDFASSAILLASSLGFAPIEVHSNLLQLREADGHALQAANAIVHFSFFGHTPELHDSVTRRSGSLAAASKNIALLQARGVRVTGHFIDTRLHGTSFDLVKRLAESLRVHDLQVDTVRALGRAAVSNANPLGELCGRCGSDTLAVAADGSVFPCTLSKFLPLGSVHQSSISELLESPKLRDARATVQECRNSQSALRPNAAGASVGFRPVSCIPAGGAGEPPPPPPSCMPVGMPIEPQVPPGDLPKGPPKLPEPGGGVPGKKLPMVPTKAPRPVAEPSR